MSFALSTNTSTFSFSVIETQTPLEQTIKSSQSHKGFKHTKESRKKITDTISKNTYKITSPEGVEIITNNINEFSREHGFSLGSLSRVATGKQSHYKGWKVEFINRIIDSVKYNKFYKLFDYNKNEYTTNSLKKFCKEFNLSDICMNSILQGKFKQHMGWTFIKMDIIDTSLLTNYYPRSKNLTNTYRLIDIDKNINVIDNLEEFCKIHNLQSSHMIKVCSGKRKHHKGWTGTRELIKIKIINFLHPMPLI